MTKSERHHYIPEFIIKGFANSEGKVAVFNKEKMRMESRMRSPKQVFFEWNRNTFKIENELTDFVEKLYGGVENRFAPVYNRIIKDFTNYELTPLDMFHVIHYIGVLYASLPINDYEMAEFIKDSKKEDFLLKIMDRETNKESSNSDKFFERFKSEPAFVQSIKIMKAIVDYLKNNTSASIENWKTYHSSNDVELHVIGDNPVILRDSNVSSMYDSELIFPLSKGITVYHSKGKTLKVISAEDRIKIDMLVFVLSKKYVCGPSSEYLNMIASMCIAKGYDNPGVVNLLKEKAFQIFK